MNRLGQHRDMVFCHQCENEWYRDEHGLICPQCHSEFTEIIERDHDPRLERSQPAENEDADSLPDLQHIHQHVPWHDVPDPDEDDIDRIMWGHRHQDRSRTPHRPDMPDGNLLMQNFATMLQGIAGRPMGPRRDHSPLGGNTRVFRHGPHMEILREGPHASIYFSSSSYSSPSPNNPGGGGRRHDPHDPMVGIPDMMAQLIGALEHAPGPRNRGERAGSPEGLSMNPIQMLLSSLLSPPGGIHGDAVYSQEAFDRVMSQLMEQNQTGTAPGPASADAIASLPVKKVDKSMLDDQGKAECSICMDEVKLNDSVSMLPCKHWFHPDCIKAWLNEHDTCPHCREGIMPKEGGNGRPSTGVRSPDQPPLHSQNPWSPGAPRGSGSQENPWIIDSPRSSRQPPPASRRSSSGRSSAHSPRSTSGPDSGGGGGGGGGGGFTDRVRNMFGGGSSSRH
ncbi:MAG: hypothetical protein M1822_005158 [Bathelium mastoideum]|nr:MAG: hypothetical protein M1822_005158 [Bathelium mastoideum]